jgi:hypothetical protein
MSERIKELARQAGLIAPYGSDREGLSDFDYREFANLIVKECARLADNSPQYIDGREILEHFGVE